MERVSGSTQDIAPRSIVLHVSWYFMRQALSGLYNRSHLQQVISKLADVLSFLGIFPEISMVTLTLYRQYPSWVQGSVSLMGRKERCEERVWEPSEREGGRQGGPGHSDSQSRR